MSCGKGKSSAHLSRVLVYLCPGSLWQFFCRKTKFVSFVLQKSLIIQGDGNADKITLLYSGVHSTYLRPYNSQVY